MKHTWIARLPAGRSVIGFAILALTLALVACGQDQPAPAVDTQATVVSAVQATVQAMPAPVAPPAPPAPTPLPTATAAPTSTPIVITVIPTPEPTTPPPPTSTPAPTSTPVVITIIATPEPTATAMPIPAPKVTTAFASISEDNSLIAMIDVELDREAKMYVEYENVDAGRFRTATTDAASTSHTVPVLRLRADSLYTFEAFAIDADGEVSEPVGGTFTTGSLPDELARIQISSTGKPTSELLLMDMRDAAATFLTIMDDEANFVWYQQTENLVEGSGISMNAIKQKENYNFVFYAGRPSTPCCLREITPLGEKVDELVYSTANGTPHHDFLLLPNDQIMYLADVPAVIDDSANGGSEEQAIVGDSIRIWDQKSGTTREVWNAFDFWDPEDPNQREQWTGNPIRWIHTNSITLGPRGNYIMSSRNRNQVMSLSPDFQKIEWQVTLGNEGSPPSDFRFSDPNDRFYRSHTASQLRNGNLLVFDNGNTRPEEEGGHYSRALELVLDDYDMVIEKVWEYRPDPVVYSRNISSAWRLENGNTLINFGNRDDKTIQPIVAVEVQRDNTEVWKMEMISETSSGRFRVYQQGPIMGETKLE